MSAVTMLVFKDTILGFVAGIQLSANRMVSRGDWIEMPKHGADGDVLDVGLTTVKVQNWDKTITTIPTYALIGESFKNWRGMAESGGRRIKRALYIDVGSIRFCDEEMLARFSKIQYIADYLKDKREEIANWNAARGVEPASLADGRHLTNVGTFRAYVVAYLRHHPMVHHDVVPTRGRPLREPHDTANHDTLGDAVGDQGDEQDEQDASKPRQQRGARLAHPVLCQNSALLKDHGCNLMHCKVLVSFCQHLTLIANKRHRV